MKRCLLIGLVLSLISCQQQPIHMARTQTTTSESPPPSPILTISRSIALGQTRIPNYAFARDHVFWARLYPGEGYSLYCNYRFDNKGIYINHLDKTAKMSVEHVFSADWMATHFGCDNRTNCPLEAFHYAAADLHNLWAADGGINSSRRDHPFAELPDHESETRFEDRGCDDFERTYGNNARVEPRDAVKGQIARSLLYMRDTYGFDLFEMNDLALDWHHNYPVTNEERWRNERIFMLQNTRNHWIDSPP